MQYSAPIFLLFTIFLTSITCPFGLLAAEESAASSDPAKKVIAKVDGTEITEAMLLHEIDQMAAYMARRIPPAQLAQKERYFFDNALERCIVLSLLTNTAAKEGIRISDAELEEKIQEIKKQFPDEEQFQAALQSQKIDEKTFRDRIRTSMIHEKLLDANVKEAELPSDASAEEFYEKNPQFFNVPEKCRASHILLTIPEGVTDEQKQAIKDKLIATKKDIEDKKITFEDAARQMSDDKGSAVQGGDLGYFQREQMVKPFADAAFSTPAGQMSDIVESQFGYHLILVADHKETSKISYDEVKDKIKGLLKERNQVDAVNAYFESLKKKAKIEQLVSKEEWDAAHPPLSREQVVPELLEPNQK
jgi:peptidyl-prolyl cis-trans isomerase C